MNKTVAIMIRLQELTLRPRRTTVPPLIEKRVVRLRASIPGEDLDRFDRLLQRQRVAVAAISQSGACDACHGEVPAGDVWMVRAVSEMITSCPHCGCFLYDGHSNSRESKVAA